MNTTLLSVHGPCTVLPEQPKTKLQKLVQALEALDRIEWHLYGGYATVAQREAVQIVTNVSQQVRRDIARQIGAVLYEDRTV